MTVSMATPRTTEGPATLAGQVRQVQEHFPELYDYLKERDREIERALRRIPSPADIELSSGASDARARLERTLRDLSPGLEGLIAQQMQELSEEDIYYGC